MRRTHSHRIKGPLMTQSINIISKKKGIETKKNVKRDKGIWMSLIGLALTLKQLVIVLIQITLKEEQIK